MITAKNKGFTMIELMVAIAVTIVIGSGSIAVISGYQAKQKLTNVKRELISNLKLALNYARTAQVPVGYGSGLKFVEVVISNKTMSAYPNGDTSRPFFTKVLSTEPSLTVSNVGSSQLWFAAGAGKLVKGVGNSVVPLTNTDTNVVINLSVSEKESDSTTVTVLKTGLVQ